MVTTYTVDVTIGAHSWTFERAEGEVEDTFTVLDGLTFGWSMPAGLGPQQPDPMIAAAVLSVPEFLAAADIDQGTPVALEVRFDPDAEDPTFAFYGSITDATAQPRQLPLPGVTLSLIAVDYTVDPGDLEDWSYGSVGFAVKGYAQLLTQLFADRPALGALPTWPLADTNGPTVGTSDSAASVLDTIRSVLMVSVDEFSTRRVILAPLIADGLPSIPRYAFDQVLKEPASSWDIHVNNIDRRTLKWKRNRRRLFNTLEATGADGDGPLSVLVSWPDAGNKVITERLTTISGEVGQLEDVADFYLPSPDDAGSWALDQFTILLSETLDDTALVALPLDLMPRWNLAQLELARSSCYSKYVTVSGLSADLNPFADSPVLRGVLDAATVTINGGNVSLETRLRRLVPNVEESRTTLAGYALGPYAGQGTNP